MPLKEDIETLVGDALTTNWDLRDGRVVPTTDNVALSGGGVELAATMLYADLADSTELAMWNRKATARICKAFLAASSHLVRANSGEVRSFDGDRVMGVFLGGSKNSSAAKCALQINWMFLNVLKPKFEQAYQSLRDGTFKLAHCTGVDTSDVLVARSGVRNANDLIWVGRAPNVAAKLSTIRNSPYFSYISGDVYDVMADSSKLSNNGQAMWQERPNWDGPIKRIFRSSWTWSP
jgi:adenylate cyclase